MISLFSLIQIILSPSGHHIFLMIQIVSKHILNVHHLWLVIHQSKHDHTEGILKLRMFIKLV